MGEALLGAGLVGICLIIAFGAVATGAFGGIKVLYGYLAIVGCLFLLFVLQGLYWDWEISHQTSLEVAAFDNYVSPTRESQVNLLRRPPIVFLRDSALTIKPEQVRKPNFSTRQLQFLYQR